VVLAGQRPGQRRTSGTDTAAEGGGRRVSGGRRQSSGDMHGGRRRNSGGGAPAAGHHLHPYSLINLIFKLLFNLKFKKLVLLIYALPVRNKKFQKDGR
jgi:hypothetical protein